MLYADEGTYYISVHNLIWLFDRINNNYRPMELLHRSMRAKFFDWRQKWGQVQVGLDVRRQRQPPPQAIK